MESVGTKLRGATGFLLLGTLLPMGQGGLSGQALPVFDAWISFADKGVRSEARLLAWGLGTATISPYISGAFTLSGGTSMATPVLAGAVACLLQLHPEWTVDQTRSALFHSGNFFREHGGPDPLFVWGYGIPDFSTFLPGNGTR